MLYQLSYSRSNGLPPKLLEWGGEDLNLCRHTPADLQSAPFGRSGTSPQLTVGTYPILPPPVKPYKSETSVVSRRLRPAPRAVSPRLPRAYPHLIRMPSGSIRWRGKVGAQGSGHKGAGEGTRTPNRLITNEMLYQLSYASPSVRPRTVTRGPGLSRRPQKSGAPPSVDERRGALECCDAQPFAGALYFGSKVRTFMIAERISFGCRIPVLPQAGMEPLPLKITS